MAKKMPINDIGSKERFFISTFSISKVIISFIKGDVKLFLFYRKHKSVQGLQIHGKGASGVPESCPAGRS